MLFLCPEKKPVPHPYTSFLIIPTGIGPSIDGFTGDALLVARTLSSIVSSQVCSLMSKLFVFEALLPLSIIAGMLCIADNIQFYVHKYSHDQPKHIRNDVWDVAMERRDKKLVKKYYPAEVK